MKVTLIFDKVTGDGLFGRSVFSQVKIPDVECTGLIHACYRASVTVHKHGCGLYIRGAYSPRVIIHMPDDTFHHIYCNRDYSVTLLHMDGSTEELPLDTLRQSKNLVIE